MKRRVDVKKRGSLHNGMKGIGYERPVNLKNLRERGPAVIAAGKSHREDKSVRRDDNPEAPVTRAKHFPTSIYHPRAEDRKHERERRAARAND